MFVYRDLLHTILTNGYTQPNRTGVPTMTIPGHSFSISCNSFFPMLTLRRVPFKGPIAEMLGFIRGCRTVDEFNALGCHYWDDNGLRDGTDMNGNVVPNPWLTNPNRKFEGDLGKIYGVQWRNFNGVDQLRNAIDAILHNPTSRRIVVSAYNPADLDKMALPPCHLLFNIMLDTVNKRMHLGFYMRSNDVYLGLPSNIIGYAFLLKVLAHATGYQPGTLQYFGMDVHLYQNSLSNARILNSRSPRLSPVLEFLKPFEGERTTDNVLDYLESLHPDDFKLHGYNPYDEELPKVTMAI